VPNASIPYSGTVPQDERIDQVFRIIRTLLGSGSPTQMDISQDQWKRTPQEIMPHFEPSGRIGQTMLPNEQHYFYQLLDALSNDPLLSKFFANEYERNKGVSQYGF
jgi:hypothetical protein